MQQQGFFEDQTQQRLQQINRGNSVMLVVLRIRPLTLKQSNINQIEILKQIDKNLVALIDTDESEKKKSKQTSFSFDFVYSREETTKKLYDQCLSGFIGGILQGFNATILAYGATGCGKTYTEGICALALIDLLGRVQQLKSTHHVILRLSYIEIYNQVIKDILVSEDKSLQLREDPKQGVQAYGATQVPVGSLLQLATLLKVGAANRSKQSTGSNEASSRSHALLLVRVETRQKTQRTKEEVNIGKLSLVDLAGSERATGGKNQRQLEGSKINKSLLVLGNCIQILAEGTGKHIPYRQSKLTRLLKQALGGNCRTTMLACVSPFPGNKQQTYNTLLYASRARNIDSNVTRNVQSTQAHLSSNLKRQNEDLKRQLRSNKNHSLPQLKLGSLSQLQTDRLSGKIDAHFAKQLTLVRAINQVSLKLDKAGFKLLKIQLEKKKNLQNKLNRAKKQGKEEDNLSIMIEEIGEQKQGLQKRLQELTFSRGNLVQEIKNGEYSNNEANSLFTHYRQKKIEVQLEQVRLRQLKMLNQKTEKDELLKLIGEQLRVRENIIEQQKIIIQKNNIINRITYSRLNNSQLIPTISQKLIAPLNSSLPRELSEGLQLETLQNTNKNQYVNEFLKNKPSKIIKRQLFDKNISNYSIGKLQRKREKSLSPLSKKKKKEGQVNKKKNQQLDLVYMQR